MSRSGYSDDGYDNGWDFIRWRGAVKAAIRGKRGQAFLLEMWKALQALPEPILISGVLQDEYDGTKVCALGAVGRARGMDMSKLEAEEPDDDEPDERAREIAAAFDIPHALAAEIMWLNDDVFWGAGRRFQRMKTWIEKHLLPVVDDEHQG